jgi:hypothetical protein
MSTMCKLLALLLANVALALLAPDAGAAPADAPDCSLYSNAVLMTWPAQAPVWQFCWRRPVNSGPQPNGSAIELFDVFYNGHRVFDRLNAPIINVSTDRAAAAVSATGPMARCASGRRIAVRKRLLRSRRACGTVCDRADR